MRATILAAVGLSVCNFSLSLASDATQPRLASIRQGTNLVISYERASTNSLLKILQFPSIDDPSANRQLLRLMRPTRTLSGSIATSISQTNAFFNLLEDFSLTTNFSSSTFLFTVDPAPAQFDSWTFVFTTPQTVTNSVTTLQVIAPDGSITQTKPATNLSANVFAPVSFRDTWTNIQGYFNQQMMVQVAVDKGDMTFDPTGDYYFVFSKGISNIATIDCPRDYVSYVTFKTSGVAPSDFDAWTFWWTCPARSASGRFDYVIPRADGTQYAFYNCSRVNAGNSIRSDFSSSGSFGDPTVFRGKEIQFTFRVTEGSMTFSPDSTHYYFTFYKATNGTINWSAPYSTNNAIRQP